MVAFADPAVALAEDVQMKNGSTRSLHCRSTPKSAWFSPLRSFGDEGAGYGGTSGSLGSAVRRIFCGGSGRWKIARFASRDRVQQPGDDDSCCTWHDRAATAAQSSCQSPRFAGPSGASLADTQLRVLVRVRTGLAPCPPLSRLSDVPADFPGFPLPGSTGVSPTSWSSAGETSALPGQIVSLWQSLLAMARCVLRRLRGLLPLTR